MGKRIFVTQPDVPPLEQFQESLKDIWKSRWLTNIGKYHKQFEKAICDYLNVDNCSLFCNGTLALIVGLQALRITGEVITTPYSFVATSNALHWNGITPVFCDIDPETFNIDAAKIESLITPKTTAILPVHVYGNPCNMEEIERIADIYGLRVIYDAAHAFGVEYKGKTVTDWGDLSILSFHSTKVFNTIEGGAVITKDKKFKKRIDYLKNFGFANEVTVVAPGINGKMNELQAAYGLLQLEHFEDNREKRKQIASFYRKELADVPGVKVFNDLEDVKHNYPYFPILVNEHEYGISRDDLNELFRSNDIFTRRYFYPLISQFPTYKGFPSAKRGLLSVAEKISREVLCLPIFPYLERNDQIRIVKILKSVRP